MAAHTPVLRIHPSDRFMPCSAEFFMEHAELLLGEGEDSFQTGHGLVIRPRGSLTAEVLLKAQERYDPALLWMTLDAQSKLGSPMDSLAEVPVYAHVKEVHLSNGSLEALEITYITFYAHNGWYALLGWGPHVGAHDGDWEHLTVRLQAPAYDCQGVWFNAHRPWDGCWVPAHEVERTAEGRPIAYVALHGHGTYPHVRAPAFGCCHAIIACITSHTCQRGLFYSSLLSCLGSLDCSALIRLHEQDVSWLLALAHCR